MRQRPSALGVAVRVAFRPSVSATAAAPPSAPLALLGVAPEAGRKPDPRRCHSGGRPAPEEAASGRPTGPSTLT